MDFIEELKWRGLYHQEIPETQKYLKENKGVVGYIGFDPTAASLGIGNLVQIIILKHFQNAGHQPIALLGGATGMIGDPSGKSAERNLLTKEKLEHNKEQFTAQFNKLFNDTDLPNKTVFLDNLDFYKDMNVLDFLRDVGKHLTVSYMMAKDSVKSRLETGISFTEFSYQLIQGYDFLRLFQEQNCMVQMGGSDQWGNLTSGVELVRRMAEGSVYAVTTPLVTKADGTKFGKTEKGNIFLDASMTSPYQFYQFWMNASDADAENFIKVFTFLPKEEIEGLITEHQADPGRRILQNKLAEEVTCWIHGRDNYEMAVEASRILFAKGSVDALEKLSDQDVDAIFDGHPQFHISRADLEKGIPLIEFLVDRTGIFPSNGEVRRSIKGNALAINKQKLATEEVTVSAEHLIKGRIIWVQNGKKKHYLVQVNE